MTTSLAVRGTEIQQGKVLNAEHRAFDFLVQQGGTREVYDGIDLTVVSYRMRHGGSFEIELDWMDGLATILLCDDPDEWPGAGIMNRNGRPVRRTFTRALGLAGISVDALRARCRDVPMEWGTERVLGLIEANAETLRANVDEIIFAWPALFSSTPPTPV